MSFLGQVKGTVVQSLHAAPLLGGVKAGFGFVMTGRKLPTLKVRATYKGLPFVMRGRDWFAVEEVLVQEEYALVNKLLSGKIAPRVFDLGANIGTFSLYVLAHFPKASCVALEASADTFAVLQETQHLNPQASWTCLCAAAWQADGFISFESSEFSTGSHVSQGGGEQVKTLCFESLLAQTQAPDQPPDQQIDLMKIDIEGAEEAFIVGQEAVLSRINHLMIELHPKRCNTAAVLTTLRAAYPYLYAATSRASAKPLLLATRQAQDLPVYEGSI